MNKQNEKNSLKIYTLNIPPTPEEPFLYSARHSEIIKNFDGNSDTFYTLNSQGEVDFYILTEAEDLFDSFVDAGEQFELYIKDKKILNLRILYQEQISYTFSFNISKVMDKHILEWIEKEERINIYYINSFDEEYFCSGLKITALPKGLIYDLQRFLQGKRSLKLPAFSEHYCSDSKFTEERLLLKAWAFYLDFSSLVQRVGNVQDTEDLVSRHIFDVLAQLQQSNCRQIQEDEVILWVGRKVCVVDKQEAQKLQPKEYYVIYLSGNFVNSTGTSPAKLIAEKSLGELGELQQIMWVSPLAEEAIPFAVISAHSLSRFNLTRKFFQLCDQLFKANYQPAHEYINSYQKIDKNHVLMYRETKVYSLVKKRKQKGMGVDITLTAPEVMNLVQWGNQEDLSVIFHNIDSLNGEQLDEAMFILSQKYKNDLEPYLYAALEKTASSEVKEAVMLGLGFLESRQGISFLVEKLYDCPAQAAFAADALLIIGNPVIPYLMPLLANKKANIRLRAVKILGAIASEESLNVLKNMGNDESIRVEKAKRKFLR